MLFTCSFLYAQEPELTKIGSYKCGRQPKQVLFSPDNKYVLMPLLDDKGFDIMRSKGDAALFGMPTKDLKTKFGIEKQNKPLADVLPTIGIKAKDLAAEMTSTNVESKNLHGLNPITREHMDNNIAVREMLRSRGIEPKQLQPAEDVNKVERRLKSEEKKALPKKK